MPKLYYCYKATIYLVRELAITEPGTLFKHKILVVNIVYKDKMKKNNIGIFQFERYYISLGLMFVRKNAYQWLSSLQTLWLQL